MKWEYHFEDELWDDHRDKKLAQLGLEGWELVHAEFRHSEYHSYIFKRERVRAESPIRSGPLGGALDSGTARADWKPF